MTNTDTKVVNLFENQQQDEALTPEQLELSSKMDEVFKKQDTLIRTMILESYSTFDNLAEKADPNVKQLIHIPIEAGFSLASMYLTLVSGKTPEEAVQMTPLVQEMSQGIDDAVAEFYEKHGDELPNELMYYALINVAINNLRQERAFLNYQDITGTTTQGANN